MRALLLSLIVVVGVAACGDGSPLPSIPAEVIGCTARFVDGRCVVPADRALRVFVPGPVQDHAVAIGGRPVDASTEPSGDGALLRITVPSGPLDGVVELSVDSARGRARFALIGPEPAVEGDEAALLAALDGASDLERGLLLSRLARLAMRAEDMPRMDRFFAEAEAAHRAVGRRSAVLRDLEAAIFAATYITPRYARARALLARHDRLVIGRHARSMNVYSAGLLAWQTGDPVTAAASFARARALLYSLGDTRVAVGIAEMEAVVLRASGRGRAALDRLDAVADALPADAVCDRARLALNTGWLQTLERERRGVGPDPRPALRHAHAAFSEGPCAAEKARRNAALNLAMAALGAGEPAEARRWLATLPADDGALALWRLDIEGRLALGAGELDTARARFERLASASADVAPEAAWRAAVGLGDTRYAAGDLAGAVGAWGHAEALLDSESLRLPLDRDRARFVTDRGRSVRRLIGALVAAGRLEDALCRARLARGRALSGAAQQGRLSGLDEAARAEWHIALARWRTARRRLEHAAAADWTLADVELERARAARAVDGRAVRRALAEALAVVERAGPRPTCGDLRRPEPGEVILAWFPAALPVAPGAAAAEQLIGFAMTDRETRAVVLPAPAADRTARDLLSPFAAEIASHRRLRLIAGGGVERIDLHAARLPGPSGGDTRPLWATHDVVWALDLPRSAARRSRTRTADALVVADPNRDLAAARLEARAVDRTLGESGWRVNVLTGSAATGPAVRRGLTAVELLHYAGHGDVLVDDPFASALPLASGGRLDIGDLIAMERVPRWVVLSGCRTGFVDPQAAAGGVTLAHGFLLAGAEGVLGTTAAVDDALAGAVGAAVATHLGSAADADLAHAVHRALAQLGERSGRAAFRVWVP